MNESNLLKYQKAKEFYLENECSLVKLSKIFHISRGKFSKWLKEEGVSVINKQNNSKVISDIFDVIDCEEKAYWLGFLYADGYVGKNGYIELGLQARDKKHVEKFSAFINSNAKISYREDTNSYRICFTNRHMNKRLNELGVIPNKSLQLTKIPNELTLELTKHFARGFIDGDGCLRLTYQTTGTPCPRLTITSGSPNFVIDLYEKLNWKAKKPKKDKRSKHAYNFEWAGLYVESMLDELYKNATVYLERKYEKYIEIKNAVLNRNNH